MIRWIAVLLLVAGAVGAGAYMWFQNSVVSAGPSVEPTRIVIERGSGLSTVARQLERASIVTNARLFQAWATWQEKDTGIKAGEYIIPAGASITAVLDLLVDGKTVVHRLTFPEGMTTYEILARLAGAQGLKGETPDDLPEGSLMPATYDYALGEDRSAIVKRMQAAMRQAITDAWDERDDGLPIASPEEMVILASIVEKETGLDGERHKVAGVFINRLRIGMKVQSDPTTIYAVTRGKGPLGRGLRRSELAKKDPYNTYHAAGLPPGPIANPGREALMAVAQPEATDALYFVADGTGGHAFSKTLAEHNRNVKKWRAIEKKRKAAQ